MKQINQSHKLCSSLFPELILPTPECWRTLHHTLEVTDCGVISSKDCVCAYMHKHNVCTCTIFMIFVSVLPGCFIIIRIWFVLDVAMH